MIPATQDFVTEPKLGELFGMAHGYRIEPVALVSFNKQGGWQVAEINYSANGNFRKRGVLHNHQSRLIRMDEKELNKEQKTRYDLIIQKLTK